MKKIVSLLLAAVMLCGTLFAFTSCDEPKDPGAEISVYLGSDVFDFDPTDYYVDDNAEQVMSLLYEPLFKIGSNGKLSNGVAKEYEVDESQRKIVIKLRETYWSDEVRVKAADFVYAWSQVLLSPNSPNPAAALLYDIENAVAVKQGDKTYSDLAAVATGTYEITITYRLGADYNQLLRNLASIATSPLRQEIVSQNPTHWSKDNSTVVTNGPFKIDAIKRTTDDDSVELLENTFTLARNKGYHQKPSAEKYTQHITPHTLINFDTTEGEVTLTYADILDKAVFYLADAPLDDRAENASMATRTDDLSTYTYVFNTTNPLFSNPNVRRALSLAIDREAVVNAVTFGKAATGFLPNSVAASIYGSTVTTRFSSDMDKAQALIEQAELEEEDMSFTLTVNDDEESLAIASIVVEAWEELGFTVTVSPVSIIKNTVLDANSGENKEILDSAIQTLIKEASYGNREFDVIAVDWQMYSKDAFVALASLTSSLNGNGTDYTVNSNGLHRANIAGWTNANYDEYVLAAFMADDALTRKEALKEAEKILLESCPIIPIMYNENFTFVSSELTNLKTDGFGNFVLNKLNQKNYHQYLPTEEE